MGRGTGNFEEIGEDLILSPDHSPDRYPNLLESERGGGSFGLNVYAGDTEHERK